MNGLKRDTNCLKGQLQKQGRVLCLELSYTERNTHNGCSLYRIIWQQDSRGKLWLQSFWCLETNRERFFRMVQLQLCTISYDYVYNSAVWVISTLISWDKSLNREEVSTGLKLAVECKSNFLHVALNILEIHAFILVETRPWNSCVICVNAARLHKNDSLQPTTVIFPKFCFTAIILSYVSYRWYILTIVVDINPSFTFFLQMLRSIYIHQLQ